MLDYRIQDVNQRARPGCNLSISSSVNNLLERHPVVFVHRFVTSKASLVPSKRLGILRRLDNRWFGIVAILGIEPPIHLAFGPYGNPH